MSDTRLISKRKPVLVRLDESERQKLEDISSAWGVTLAAAIRRLIREKKVRGAS
jgi:hypothetical protein